VSKTCTKNDALNLATDTSASSGTESRKNLEGSASTSTILVNFEASSSNSFNFETLASTPPASVTIERQKRTNESPNTTKKEKINELAEMPKNVNEMDTKFSKLQEACLENLNRMKNDLKQMLEQGNQFLRVFRAFCQQKESKLTRKRNHPKSSSDSE
jgi:hypothetical protein